jgi:hypothetical protein
MELWYLSIMFGAGLIMQTTSGTPSPVQMERFGPMSQAECAVAANGLNVSPNFHAQCESQIPGGVMIQSFPTR